MNHFNGMKAAALAAAVLLLAACDGSSNRTGGGGGGNGGDNGGGNGDPVVEVGVLLDAAVAGVRYETTPSDLSGFTNADGEFDYVDGDTVAFSVGSISLGSVPAKGVLTPVDIANAYTNLPTGVTAQDVARNIAIFLQSFDSDGNPDNGITIGEAVTNAATVQLNFLQLPAEFVTQPELLQLAADTGSTIVSPDDAAEHFERTLEIFLSGTWILQNDPGSDLALLSFFPGGRYVLGIQHVDENCGNGLEFGTYELNADTMELIITGTSVDTTGNASDPTDCGLSEDGEGGTMGLEIVSATHFQMVFEEDGEEVRLDFFKVLTDGVSGSWSFIDDENAGLLVLLADGQYMQIQVSEENNDPGIEVGTWSVDENGVLSSTQIVDTNGDAGLSDAHGVELSVDSYGRLSLSVQGEGEYVFPSHPYRLSLEGNSATSVITSSDCPGATGGWTYVFNADDMTWTGSDSFNSDGKGCSVGDQEVMTVPYTQEDAPFACGSSVCGYYDLNAVLEGVDEDGRDFVSTYTHVPGSDVVTYVKETEDAVFTEVITLQ